VPELVSLGIVPGRQVRSRALAGQIRMFTMHRIFCDAVRV